MNTELESATIPKVKQPKIRKIAVIIPCYNEEKAIASVIKRFPHDKITRNHYDIKIYVIDNNSTDKTAEIAKKAGAIVIHEPKKGKGNAIRKGFSVVPDDTDYVVMLDGDDTYCPEEVLRLVEPLNADFCDVTIGSRLNGNIQGESMSAFNMFGNHLFTTLVRLTYHSRVSDVLTGYFAWKTSVVKELRPHLKSSGFAIEMEMISKMSRMGVRIASLPITYLQRNGESNLSPIGDGWKILKMYTRNIYWQPRKKWSGTRKVKK